MFDTAIGAAIHNDVLTIAVRDGNQLAEPESHKLTAPSDAVATLLELKFKHRHDDPVVYLESSSTAGAVMEKLDEADRREGLKSRDQIVNGLSPSYARAGTGVEYYDKRSELHYRFRERVAQKRLLVPAAYNEDITAFAEEVKGGKVFFPYVQDVATRLGHWPVLAVVAVLAAIEVPRRSHAPRKEYDPYENIP
jgi:hypothetical protein